MPITLVLSVRLFVLTGPYAVGGDPIAFDKVALPTTEGERYTTVTFGPDGKLYATVQDGEIRRWPINPDGTTGATEVIAALQTAEGGNRLTIGLVFDPAATADNLIAWVSHATFGFSGMADWGGKISRLSGPNLETVQDFVINLPRSSRDHVTNGVVFGPDGAIYFLQGSNSAMGAPDSGWANRPERLLNAAALRLDPALVTSPPLNAKTQDGGAYDPFAPGAPLTLYGTGIRNAFDLVWHTNGRLYVPVNGSTDGGNTPEGAVGASCIDGGTYPGPAVPGLTNVAAQNDYLYRVESGGYYGHPNPIRCEFVMNGGNPTAGADTAEVKAYPVGTQPDVNYRGIAYNFGLHKSPDGIIEYRSTHFCAGLRGKLLVAQYSQADDIIVLEPGGPSGDIVSAQTGIPGMTGFADPLDLTEDLRTGYLYVAEYAGQKITLLRPVGSPPPAPGDFDGDCIVNLIDYEDFRGCLGGPAVSPDPPPPVISTECLDAFDFDADQDVDLGDFAEFSGLFSAA